MSAVIGCSGRTKYEYFFSLRTVAAEVNIVCIEGVAGVANARSVVGPNIAVATGQLSAQAQRDQGQVCVDLPISIMLRQQSCFVWHLLLAHCIAYQR